MENVVTTTSPDLPKFNKIREFFWPIHSFELKKFLPMSLLMFCIIFVYTMVRDIKDVCIQKFAIAGSTELIPAIKLWFVLPAAFFAVMLFTFLVNKYGDKKTFYIMTSIFLIFFALFAFVLFPNHEKIHPDLNTVRSIQAAAPAFLVYIIPCVTNWSFTLFYVFAEMWSVVMISSLFWQFANKITMPHEVKRFFAFYSILANIGGFLSGTTLVEMSRVSDNALFSKNLSVCVGFCVAFGILQMCTYYYINKYVVTDKSSENSLEINQSKQKEKVGVMEGIRYLFKSPYLALVSVLVLGYGAAIQFVEFIMKKHASTVLPPNELSQFMGKLSQAITLLTILMTWFGTYVLRRFKWKVGAMITPAIIGFMGMLFYITMFYLKNGNTVIMGISLPMFALWTGLLVDAVAKAVKYCLFDTTKSMTYIPLDEAEKTKGQAAVEVVGGRAGKAGASLINFLLTSVIVPGSQAFQHIYTVAGLFGAVILGWLGAVSKLSKKYEAKMKEKGIVQKS